MSEEVRLIDANELLRNIAKQAYLISHDNGISVEYGMSCFGILQCIAEAKTIDAPEKKNVKVYSKLVRDKIPEIIKASGKICTTEILSNADYIRALDAKLDEELAEYHNSHNTEELADLLEVIRAVSIARGCSLNELERIRAEKVKQRGGFEKKILLKEVTEE
jgi:predicted house-cleaning noncanonical NTP pyrophosphatase (MazG superfamily)